MRGMNMAKSWMQKFAKPALLGGAMLGLSACAYRGGSYGDGYVNGAGYACDPYASFDDYYACDYGYGYANIGFGGGWYDNFYYPGYGVYIFDRRGSRYAMKRHHRYHWARQRAEFGSRHARRGGPDGVRKGGRNLTPEQRAERRERWRNLTPEQRADRRERRAERRSERNDGNRATTGRAALRDGAIRGQRNNEARQARRSTRQGNSARSERAARPATSQQRSQQARPAVRQSAPAARSAPRQAPRARAPSRSSRSEVSRRNVSDN